VKIVAMDIYSAAVVGKNATGTVRLFEAALGDVIARIGETPDTLFPIHTQFTTNLPCIGELGSSIGDASIEDVHLDFVGASAIDIQRFLDRASYRMIIAGQCMSERGVQDLPVHGLSILVSRHDTIAFEFVLKGEPLQIDAPFLVKVIWSVRVLKD
jgi:hypothetical protein